MSEKLNKLPKIEYITITPELARQWLDERMFERQREVRPAVVRQYSEKMKRGEWRPWTILQFTESGNGSSVGTDGQHRLLAVEDSGLPIQAIVVTYPGASLSDVADRYIYTDKGKSRSSLDTIVALGLAEKHQTTNTLINKAWTAVNLIANKFEDNKATWLESDAIRLLEEEGYIEVAKIYNELVGAHGYSGGFYRRSTMAVALYTLKYAPELLEEEQVRNFWYESSKGIGEDPDDPRRKLHEHCMSQSMYTSVKSGVKQEAVSLLYSVRFTAKCWNHFLGKKSIKQRRVSTTDKLVIEATPLGRELKVERK